MDNKFGGFALNLDVDIYLDSMLLEQSLSYSEFESSRYFDFKKGLYIYEKSNLKNWGASGYSYYGGLGDIEQIQKTFTYNLDATLKEFEAFNLSHKFIAGFEYEHKSGSYKTLTPMAEYGVPKALPSGYRCMPGGLTCVNDDSFKGAGQYLSEIWYYGNVNNRATMDKVSFYIEDEITYDRLKVRPGVRIERNSITKDTNIAPRFTTEYEFVDKNFFGFGLNRYYGRDLFAQKIYNDMYAHQEDFKRNSPNEKFQKVGNDINGFLANEIKTPYDDELSLFYRGDIKNLKFGLKYIKRKSRDEVVTKSRTKAGYPTIAGLSNNYSIYTNEGKTDSDIFTFSVQNIEPLEFLNTPNNFEFSFTYLDRKRNFNTYTDRDLDQRVLYNGNEIAYEDLPVVDFYTPYSIKLSHTMKIPKLNLTISNFINYQDGNEILIRSYNRAKRMTSYEKYDLPSHTTWDMKISYNQKLHNDIEFFTNLDINNILNKKYAVDASTSDGSIYKVFDSGRNFWLEAGLRW